MVRDFTASPCTSSSALSYYPSCFAAVRLIIVWFCEEMDFDLFG